MSKEELKERLIEMMDQDEHDYHALPHYGLIADWFPRYWDLANMIRTYLQAEELDARGS
jgi:hypothetical protein|tara:strand:- start:208 stop:384 length:177 start_codon:yes stop_codon:yes gene_type:complete